MPKRSLSKIVTAVFCLVFLLILFHRSSQLNDPIARIKQKGYLSWGSDAEGGAPYVFPDPKQLSKLVGFEVDIAEAIAQALGVKQKQVQNAWDSLVPALQRGDFDIAMNGIEITPQRKEKILFSEPYYIYREQLTVRKEEARIRGVGDLKGMKVGTLSGTVAQNILTRVGGADVRIYPGQVEPYEDLALGRIDAVLLDLPIAAYYGKPNPKLKYAGEPVGEGLYAIAIRKQDAKLKEKIDEALLNLIKSGRLKEIYQKWDMWDDAQERLFDSFEKTHGFVGLEESKRAALSAFLPKLLRGAGITLFISTVAMALAVSLGLLLAVLRLYARPPLGALAAAYIEVYRGTPLLVQLYILYYGLPNIGISLSPLLAAFLGLGMNYAAYEAELYRAGINAIPRGQTEAALSLGMPRRLVIKRIILPQGLRIALPGITNDFIALFKDSSIVSIIAMVELTKTYTILAATSLKFFELGLITALLYFGMSFPLSLIARKLERRLKRVTDD